MFLRLVVAAIILACAEVFSADFYVSNSGDDSSNGTKDNPFKTLERARQAVCDARVKSPPKAYTVEIADGIYHLDKPFKLSAKDTALDGFPTIYKAQTPGRVSLSGAVEIKDWKKSTNPPSGFNTANLALLWEADVSEILDYRPRIEGGRAELFSINCLFKNGRFLPNSKSGRFYIKDSVPIDSAKNPKKGDANAFRLDAIKLPDYFDVDFSALARAIICVIPRGPWELDRLYVKSLDELERVVYTKNKGIYESYSPAYRFANMWLENYAPDLDTEGEWLFDADSKKVYIISSGKPEGVFAARLPYIVRIDGKSLEGDAEDVLVENIRFEGITFSHSDSRSLDNRTAAVELSCVRNIEFVDCVFSAVGADGISIFDTAQNNTVRNCLFEDLGGAGVRMSGYQLGRKPSVTMVDNLIENCVFARCGKIYMERGALLQSRGARTRISRCTIFDMPWSGVCIRAYTKVLPPATGRGEFWNRAGEKYSKGISYPDIVRFIDGNNMVEGCEIFRTGETLGDANGIYICASARDKVVGNFIHDLRGWFCNAAIRFDDNQQLSLAKGNITYRNVGFGLISKGSNDIIGNIFAEPHLGRYNTEIMKGGVGLSVRGGYPAPFRIEKNIFFVSAKGNPMPFQFYLYSPKRWPFDARYMSMDYNLYAVDSSDQSAAESVRADLEKKYGFDKNGVSGDPQFISPEDFNFSFDASSPAARLGIRAIDVSRCGVYGKMKKYVFPRISSPVIEALNFKRPDYEGVYFPFERGMKIKVSLPKGAEKLRYTLDGSVPSEDSPELKPESAFEIKSPCEFRVRAFASGGKDLLGDRIIFDTPIPVAPAKKQ